MGTTPNGERKFIHQDEIDAAFRARGMDVPKRAPRKEKYRGAPEPHGILIGSLLEEHIARQEEDDFAAAEQKVEGIVDEDTIDEDRVYSYDEIEEALAEERQKQVDDVDREVAKKAKLPWYRKSWFNRKK